MLLAFVRNRSLHFFCQSYVLRALYNNGCHNKVKFILFASAENEFSHSIIFMDEIFSFFFLVQFLRQKNEIRRDANVVSLWSIQMYLNHVCVYAYVHCNSCCNAVKDFRCEFCGSNGFWDLCYTLQSNLECSKGVFYISSVKSTIDANFVSEQNYSFDKIVFHSSEQRVWWHTPGKQINSFTQWQKKQNTLHVINLVKRMNPNYIVWKWKVKSFTTSLSNTFCLLHTDTYDGKQQINAVETTYCRNIYIFFSSDYFVFRLLHLLQWHCVSRQRRS